MAKTYPIRVLLSELLKYGSVRAASAATGKSRKAYNRALPYYQQKKLESEPVIETGVFVGDNANFPKILYIDIETPHLKADMGRLLVFGWRWHHEKRTRAISIDETKAGRKDTLDDSDLVRHAHKIMLEADCIVYHYGDKFDLPYLKSRMINLGLYMPRIQTVDTCKVSRYHMNITRNSLAVLAEHLGVRLKTSEPKAVWIAAILGRPWALKKLKRYCINDVNVLYEVAQKLKPYCKLINYNNFVSGHVCRNCGSPRLENLGRRCIGNTVYTRLRCLKCGTTNKLMGKRVSGDNA